MNDASTPDPAEHDDAHLDADGVPASAAAASTGELLAQQNELLREILANQKAYRPVLHTALGVLLGFAVLWGVAQTDWGAENVAVPVKFFVSQDQAETITDGQDALDEITDPGTIDELLDP